MKTIILFLLCLIAPSVQGGQNMDPIVGKKYQILIGNFPEWTDAVFLEKRWVYDREEFGEFNDWRWVFQLPGNKEHVLNPNWDLVKVR